MRPLFNEFEFKNSKTNDKLPCLCYTCNNKFFIKKKQIVDYHNNRKSKCKFCSQKCNTSRITKTNVTCKHCKKIFKRTPSQIKKSNNQFCNQSCATTYNNKHKTTGIRISKLEVWIQSKLDELYPNLEIHYNRKEAINSELDIYIPLLNLAFELNGVFHYEPIFGVDKLQKIQENDQSKSKACYDAKIDLYVINTSKQICFKEKTSQKYLNVITNMINLNLNKKNI